MSNREQLNLFENKYNLIDDQVNESFWAYHAGMADGDGSFKISKGKYPYYQLSLIDKNIIKELADLYKVTITKLKKQKKKHNQRYVVSICGKNYRHFIQKIYPSLIEKRDVIKKIMKEQDIEIIKNPDYRYTALNVSNNQLAWLAGYFDAEGCIIFDHRYNKKSKNYTFYTRVTLTSTNLKVLRYAKRLMNRVFNRSNNKHAFKIVPKTVWKDRTFNEAPCWDLVCSQMAKTHLFSKIYQPIIKVKRKIKKMDRLINYGEFCADMKWNFGKINFKKNEELRQRWLKK